MKQKSNLRSTGIKVIGDIPWGTHFCLFYETKQDLLNILIPYFKEGLKHNEKCVWVTSEFLTAEESKIALQKSVSGFSKYLKDGQIEIFPYTEWYLKNGTFEMKRVLADWVNKHDTALEKGYEGLRVSGNPFWINNKKDWEDFAEYESEINKIIDNYKLLVFCTYSLNKCSSIEVLDVINNHEFSLIKRNGGWTNIESVFSRKIGEALRKTESRYNSYVELTDQIVWTTDAKGLVEDDVPTWRKFTGQSYEEVKGLGWTKALHPDDLKRTIKVWQNAVLTKNPYKIEYRLRMRNGTYRHFLVQGVPIYKKDGSISEWIGISMDITNRKMMETELVAHATELESLNKSLQEAIVKQEALLESIGDSVIATDKDGKIILLNKRTEDLFGWKTKNMMGKSLFMKRLKLTDQQGNIIPIELRPVKMAMTTGRVGHGIYFFEKRKTEKIPLFITSSPIMLNGELAGAINIYRDVSQQVAVDQAKDEFLYFASHTLRTPLSAIAWSIEQLSEDSIEYSEEQKKSLNVIYDQTQRMIQLTNDLLNATRMELGILSYKYEEVNPLKIASNVITDLQNKIKDKSIKLKLVARKNITPYFTYSNALYIILHNILTNAVKFTPNKGRISLEIKKTAKNLVLKVADSGIGIPKSAQSKIFQKMYRANNVIDKFEGSGLGLYITSGIINNMGGKIIIKSKEGKGAIFIVTLPLTLQTMQTKITEHL